jgi:hypothetical protein
LEKLTEETRTREVSEKEIRAAFKIAHQMLKSGELKNSNAIYQCVTVYQDRIELTPNFYFDLEKTKPLNAGRRINVSGTSPDANPRNMRGYDGKFVHKRRKRKARAKRF